MSDNPDSIKSITVEYCKHCGDTDCFKIIGKKRRQAIDIEIKKTVTEFQAEIGECDRCNKITIADFPDEITQDVQYGA